MMRSAIYMYTGPDSSNAVRSSAVELSIELVIPAAELLIVSTISEVSTNGPFVVAVSFSIDDFCNNRCKPYLLIHIKPGLQIFVNTFFKLNSLIYHSYKQSIRNEYRVCVF